jgi:hypothetical protein
MCDVHHISTAPYFFILQFFIPTSPQYTARGFCTLCRKTASNNLGCDFFGWKINMQICRRTFRNYFWRMVSFVFLAPLGDFLLVPEHANKTDKSKRKGVCFGGKVLTDKKLPPLLFRSIFISTHHFLCFCLFFLSVPADLVGKQCGRRLGGQLFNSSPKVHSKVRQYHHK